MSRLRTRSTRKSVFILLLSALLAFVAGPLTPTAIASPAAAAVSPQSIADLANAHVGNGCASFSTGSGETACHAEWCAVFAGWIWRGAGVSPSPDLWVATDIGGWAIQNGVWKPRPAGSAGSPAPGDIVVFGAPNSGVGGHVAIVYSVNPNGTITTINGDDGSGSATQTHVLKETINPVTATSGVNHLPISGYASPPGVSSGRPSAGKVFDNMRRADAAGSWTGASVSDGGGTVSQMAVAGLPDGSMHLETLSGGRVFDNFRRADGSWSGPNISDGGGTVSQIAITGLPDGTMHLETLSGGRVFDNVRRADGSWTGANVSDGGGQVSQIAVAGMPDGSMHLETLTGGLVFDNVRRADGSWTGPSLVDGGGTVGQIAVAALPDGSMHLETLTGGRVFDNFRRADGSWAGPNISDGGGTVSQIAITALPDGSMHLETLTGGRVFDNVRRADGSWAGPNVSDGGGKVFWISIAGMPDGTMHLETLV